MPLLFKQDGLIVASYNIYILTIELYRSDCYLKGKSSPEPDHPLGKQGGRLGPDGSLGARLRSIGAQGSHLGPGFQQGTNGAALPKLV